MYNGEYTKQYRKQLQESLDRDNELLINKHKQVEDLNYEISLIKNHSVQSLKEFSDPLQAIDFQSIWRDFDHEKHKFNSKESKNTISFLEENFFFAKDTKRKLLEVVQFQFGESYEFIYKVDGGKIIIEIPKYRLTNEDNYLTIMVYREAEPYEVVETCPWCGSIFKPSQSDLLPYDMPDNVVGCYGVVECPVCGNKHICTQGPVSDDE